MRNFFWPARQNPNPTAFTRFGRVLHWIATGIFVLMGLPAAAFAVYGAYEHLSGRRTYYYEFESSPGLTTLGISATLLGLVLLLYLLGRALRYIFSGE